MNLNERKTSKTHSRFRLFDYSVIRLFPVSIIRLFDYSIISQKRRGSALLVVLGMLAFMVISAVAFSAYMRHSRLPSSYLRRASSSRHLAKAALAQAIDMIDAMIGNDRYPGQGNDGGSYRWPRHDGRSEKRNYWTERCFIGTNQLMSVDGTVSTLCLEGLAYLPPALINEARYYSRRSAAAAWHTFGFDSGRFAFSAFDVSDCIDISRVLADHGTGDLSSGRNSSDRGRIKLAYAFENANHTGFQVDPEDWDEFMEKFRDPDGNADRTKVPLTSLADFNLALHKDGPSSLVSPFCRFIENGTPFVSSETGTEAELQRHMLFTADSLFPQTNRTTGTTIDLTNSRHQPLFGLGTDAGNRNEAGFDQVAQNNNTFMSTYASRITPSTMAQLHDYLDRDSIPISLALPTAERTPMITGFSLQGMLTVGVAQGTTRSVVVQDKQEQYDFKPYTLQIQGDQMSVMVGAVFPFKYKRGSQRKFKAQAAMTITFVPAGSETELRPGQDSWATVPVWPNGSQNAVAAFYQGVAAPSGLTAYTDAKPLDFKDDIREEDDAVLSTDLKLDFSNFAVPLVSELPASSYDSSTRDTCSFRTVDKVEKDPGDKPQGPYTGKRTPNIEQMLGCMPSLANLSGPAAAAAGAIPTGSFVPVVQIWVRIIDPENNVVDLVPACVADDKTQSSFITQASGSSVRPALRFNGGASVAGMTFDTAGFTTPPSMSINNTFSPQAYITDDPRFNYAPENFAAFAALDGQVHAMWMNRQRSEKRDGDIFMTTSDAGYLQSPYELANLLRFSGLSGGSGWGILQSGEHGGYNGKARNGFEDLAAESAMWRTFSQYDVNGDWDDIAGLDMRTGSKGFRMSPYAASKETMMSVFANTPLDWWAASTNDVTDAYGSAKTAMLDSLTEAMKYTYSKHSGAQVQIEWNDMQSVAEYVRGVFRNNASRSWEDKWDDLAWDYNHSDESSQEKLFGIDLKEPLHSVDRKFLHGYWRDCFSNRQQLFLIFVRAEPMMMGGGAVGQTPPQLGARAVALVWRDPNPTRADNDGEPRPHQTRVLFYRQFD